MNKTPKNKCLEHWTGEFGNQYLARNRLTETKIKEIAKAFGKMIGSLDIRSILEVGTNVGNNLCGIHRFFDGKVKTFGVEPNKSAFELLEKNAPLMNLERAFNCDAFTIPMEDASVDLVFTSGVLIHISPGDLGRALDEIYRISGRYILCSEYFSHEPEEKKYHGEEGLLFKRDFGGFYLDRFGSKIECVNYGFLWQREYRVFDNLNWWLFEKKQDRRN